MSYGEKIARLRKEHGMTQDDLGKAMNVSYQAVSKWERDESQPDFATMSKIAKLFEVPLSYFADGAPDEPIRAEQPAPRTLAGTCTECGKAIYEGEEGETQPKLLCVACVERKKQESAAAIAIAKAAAERRNKEAATRAEQPAPRTLAGTCTECGKVVYEGEEGETQPKLLCVACAERKKQEAAAAIVAAKAAAERRNKEAAAARAAAEQSQKRIRREAVKAEIGKKWGGKLTAAVLVALALYVLFIILVFSNPADADLLSVLLGFVPLCGFGLVFSIADFIADLRDKDDDESYCLATSLVTAGAFAIVNIALFLILHFTLNSPIYVPLLVISAIVSFTFVSQFAWGGVVQDIFSAGGFTFKLPGFIFSLSFDSILFMIIAKIFLTIIAAIVFIATTVFMALVALFGSVIIFIPSLLATYHSEHKAKQELKALQ